MAENVTLESLPGPMRRNRTFGARKGAPAGNVVGRTTLCPVRK